jgi:glycosyltransferase EpsF
MGKMVNGGVEAVIMNYYRNIDRSKIQFDFFVDADSTVIPKDEIEQLGGRVYIVPPYQKLPAYIRELTKIFKANQYKIVHSNLNTLSVFPLYAAKKAGVPFRIAHNHSTAGKGETKKNILKYILRPFAKINATHYAACSEYAGEWLFGKKSMQNGEVTVFSNAIDLDKFKYDEAVRADVRRELGIEGKLVIGHVGRFCYQKNHEFLIDIFEQVHKKEPNTVLLLIGDGETRASIENAVNSKGLANNVKFLGIRSDVNRLYQAMDVFLFPSRYEGLPVTGVEAQTSGLPCVLSSAITKEIDILKSNKMLDLNIGVYAWRDEVINALHIDNKTRITEFYIMQENGFDIHIESQKLCEYYIKMVMQ